MYTVNRYNRINVKATNTNTHALTLKTKLDYDEENTLQLYSVGLQRDEANSGPIQTMTVSQPAVIR